MQSWSATFVARRHAGGRTQTSFFETPKARLLSRGGTSPEFPYRRVEHESVLRTGSRSQDRDSRKQAGSTRWRRWSCRTRTERLWHTVGQKWTTVWRGKQRESGALFRDTSGRWETSLAETWGAFFFRADLSLCDPSGRHLAAKWFAAMLAPRRGREPQERVSDETSRRGAARRKPSGGWETLKAERRWAGKLKAAGTRRKRIPGEKWTRCVGTLKGPKKPRRGAARKRGGLVLESADRKECLTRRKGGFWRKPCRVCGRALKRRGSLRADHGIVLAQCCRSPYGIPHGSCLVQKSVEGTLTNMALR